MIGKSILELVQTLADRGHTIHINEIDRTGKTDTPEYGQTFREVFHTLQPEDKVAMTALEKALGAKGKCFFVIRPDDEKKWSAAVRLAE